MGECGTQRWLLLGRDSTRPVPQYCLFLPASHNTACSMTCSPSQRNTVCLETVYKQPHEHGYHQTAAHETGHHAHSTCWATEVWSATNGNIHKAGHIKRNHSASLHPVSATTATYYTTAPCLLDAVATAAVLTTSCRMCPHFQGCCGVDDEGYSPSAPSADGQC